MRKTIGLLLRNYENWILSILGAFSASFVHQTFSYRPGAGLFPRLVGFVVASLCFYQLAENIWKVYVGQTNKVEKTAETLRGLTWHLSYILIILYFGLIYLIGFVWGTCGFLIFFPFAAGYRRWTTILIVAIVTAILIEVSFNMLLQISLPRGILFNMFW